MIKHSEEFNREAVWIALTSGLARQRVASDLDIGKSTLGKWLAQYRSADPNRAPQADLAHENERLRLENLAMRVSTRGYRSWQSRPIILSFGAPGQADDQHTRIAAMAAVNQTGIQAALVNAAGM